MRGKRSLSTCLGSTTLRRCATRRRVREINFCANRNGIATGLVGLGASSLLCTSRKWAYFAIRHDERETPHQCLNGPVTSAHARCPRRPWILPKIEGLFCRKLARLPLLGHLRVQHCLMFAMLQAKSLCLGTIEMLLHLLELAIISSGATRESTRGIRSQHLEPSVGPSVVSMCLYIAPHSSVCDVVGVASASPDPRGCFHPPPDEWSECFKCAALAFCHEG